MKHTVKLDDIDYTINTTQKGPAAWTAGGDFKGQSLFVQDRSEAAALKRWQQTARARD